MTKTHKALAWGCLPGVLMIANLMLYGLVNFLGSSFAQQTAEATQNGYGTKSSVEIIVGIIRIIQSFAGIALMILIPVGIVMAIVIATKEDEVPTAPAQPPQQNQ
ncbi:MAG: hypothetical protein QG607_6 [Patescibacteria group bacterium]|nr:hypothetical protein [Patescibacteria group bacterium]